MAFNIEAACGCILGNGRDQNEDNFYFHKKRLPVNHKGLKSPLKFKGSTDDTVLFAVFDGMGGGAKGEEASFTASEIFASEIKQLDEFVIDGKEFLINTCTKASKEIYQISRKKQVATMGTTVAALYFPQDEVYACNVGDSKIYRIRSGQMTQISRDHTDENISSNIGVKKKPVLLQYLGVPDNAMTIDPYISKGDLQRNDVYVICSDGVTDSISASELYEIIKRIPKPDEIVKTTMGLINQRNGADNATLIIVRVG